MQGDGWGVAGIRTRKGYEQLDNLPVYKAHRIHTSLLMRGSWISTIVTLGKRKPLTKDSLTATATLVPGEYHTEEETLQAAKRYIDEEDAHRQEQPGENADAPAYVRNTHGGTAHTPAPQERSRA